MAKDITKQHVVLGLIGLALLVFLLAAWSSTRASHHETVKKQTPSSSSSSIQHVLVTGQSLALGAAGEPALSVEQPYEHLMLEPGGRRLVPLREEWTETLSSAFANALGPKHTMLMSTAAVGGTPYRNLKKGTPTYAASIKQIENAKRLAGESGRTYSITALLNVHGESDHQLHNLSYDRDLREWQHDYEKDIGVPNPLPMFISQIAMWSAYGDATSDIPRQQLEAHKSSAGKIILVGSKYHLEYAVDGVHLTNVGYRHMGEDYAKAYKRVVIDGQPWEPLRPMAITRKGKEITVRFAVPSPPIVLDESLVTNPGNFGFEYDGADIAGVRVTGPDTVVITLGSENAGRLRYAYTSVSGTPAGPRSGPRGNVRDSDATPSRFGFSLYNWCVCFDEAVP